MQQMITVLALGPLMMIVLGFVLLWAVSLATFNRGRDATVWVQWWRVIGWITLLTGILMLITFAGNCLLIIVASVVVLAVVMRYWVAERKTLLWVLAVAAERGIPLQTAARALADEQGSATGSRARRLADDLEAGVPLGLSLKRASSLFDLFPFEAVLAADLGQQTGCLGPALRQLVDGNDQNEDVLRSGAERCFYMMCLLSFGGASVTFLMLKIVPVMAKMFDEYELALPAATQLLVFLSDTFISYLFLPILMVCLLLALLGVFLYLGFSLRSLPLVRRLWWSTDRAMVMRWLAIAVRQKLPLAEMIRLLAIHFPQAVVRSRLTRALKMIDHGTHWCDSLRQARLLRWSEEVLFKSAERAGNLAWALDEMANSGIRMLGYRLSALSNIVFPAILLFFGAGVLLITAGIMLPLISLIQGLS